MNADDVSDNLIWQVEKDGQTVGVELQDNDGYWLLVDATAESGDPIADVRPAETSGDLIKSLSVTWLDGAEGFTITGVSL